ncbi:MAG TPA: hypothetical protein VF599_08660 [Pyrinomonadaceae bacterium]|jgi:hypothetical protein
MKLTKFIITFSFICVLTSTTYSQWVPTGNLAAIPVIENCGMTGGDIAIATFPPFSPRSAIFFCQGVVNQLNSFYPGAGHFYFVHEFGHHALNSADERATDCWAAQQLANSPNGRQTLNVAIKHFYDRGTQYHPRYGTGFERAQRIYNCANLQTPGAGFAPTTTAVISTTTPQVKSLADEMSSVDTTIPQTAATLEFARAINLLLESAQTNFVSLRGQLVNDNQSELQKKYVGLFIMQGFENCRTYEKTFGNPSPTYGCKLTIANSDVDSRFNQLITQVRSLVPSGWIIQQVANELNFVATEGEGKRNITIGVVKGSGTQSDIMIWFSSPETRVNN